MDISALTTSTGTTATTSLQSQLQSKQLELQRAEASKMDETAKATKIREIKAQIEALKTQIQQRSEAKTTKAAKTETSTSTGSVDALV